MNAKIILLPGDGIGPEVTKEAELLIECMATEYGTKLVMQTALIGGAAIDATGYPLPDETLAACRSADAVILGAVGGPKWSDPNAKVRPEQGLLKIRSVLFESFSSISSVPWAVITKQGILGCFSLIWVNNSRPSTSGI